MRTFVNIMNGVARIMRTYALDPDTRRVLQDAPGAPDAAELIATKWHPKNASEVTRTREITEANVPNTAAFKDAWEDDGKDIVINMAKAYTIKTDQIRPERDRRLTALDVDYLRSDEAGNAAEKQRIAAVKQELRDLPATIQPDLNAITTPEALEAWQPAWPE